MDRSLRSGAKLCLLMCDIDDFKMINDRFGHITGDAVLEGIAELIRIQIRSSDFAGRYGGEEFTVALLDSDLPEALATARRLVEAVAGCDFGDLTDHQVTTSIGVAAWDRKETLSGFIHRADEALYLAKRHGKNRVETQAHDPV